ncbi:MAG: flavin reductase family protein [Lachnospiraceae bacterium]|nr:flavin reductase family protein [Lachnospiraceae bacterium]
MGKQSWKPGNMLYPLPVVLVSAADKEGNTNVLTVAWAGTVCSDPPMVSVSIRPERYSYRMIKETGEFVINLTTEELAYATDYCGVVSGRDADKFKNMHLTPVKGDVVKAPLIKESPVNIECIVKDIKSLGSHDMFIAQVAAVHVDEKYMDTKNKFHLEDAHPIVYSHGIYMSLGKKIGTFGYSVRKGPNPRGGRKSK